MIAVRDLVEPIAAVGDDPREDVDATRRALGIRLGPQPRRQGETLLQRDEVRPLRLEHHALAPEVEFVDDELGEAVADAATAGQETAADAIGDLAEAQIEAGRLDIRSGDGETARVHDPRGDRALEVLTGEHAAAVGGKVEVHGRMLRPARSHRP